MYKSYSMELAGRTLTVDIGRVCAQANGAALLKYGETTVLSTATASDKPRDGVDFFPLSVEFEEKMYSVGKIPGGFNKREGIYKVASGHGSRATQVDKMSTFSEFLCQFTGIVMLACTEGTGTEGQPIVRVIHCIQEPGDVCFVGDNTR